MGSTPTRCTRIWRDGRVWFMALVSKTRRLMLRGFKSRSLRQNIIGELSLYRMLRVHPSGTPAYAGQIPLSPPEKNKKKQGRIFFTVRRGSPVSLNCMPGFPVRLACCVICRPRMPDSFILLCAFLYTISYFANKVE